jgi:hypothetical protein
MKKIVISLFCCLFMLTLQVSGQYYTQLVDVSGFDTQPYQAELDTAAKHLVMAMPDTFQNKFRVYSGGFYVLQETYTGFGYPEAFEKLRNEAAARSEFYLVIGRQSDSKGIYSKFWVDIKLPEIQNFSCLTPIQREIYKNRVKKKIIEKYKDFNNLYSEYAKAESIGMEELQKIVEEIKLCCPIGGANRMPGCSACGSDMIRDYLETFPFKFEKYSIITENAPEIDVQTNFIYDLSDKKTKAMGYQNYDYISTQIEPLINKINKDFSLKLLITSDSRLCNENFDGSDFIRQSEFGAWINLGANDASILNGNTTGSSDFSITVYWNEDKKNFVENQKQADGITEVLKCLIKNNQNISNSNCPMPQVFHGHYPFCQSSSQYHNDLGDPGLHDIAWFINELVKEENNWPEGDRSNTKLMISRLRKIFYNTNAWNTIIIPATADISGMYQERDIPYAGFPKFWQNPLYFTINENPHPDDVPNIPAGFHIQDIEGRPLNAQNQSPNIYCDNLSCSNWNQEVMDLSSNCIIDLGHVLTGIDAINNPSPVLIPVLGQIPLLNSALVKMYENKGAATWIGDIGSVISEYYFQVDNSVTTSIPELNFSYPSESEYQNIVDKYASGADMLGNVDAYVIAKKYNVNSSSGGKVSDILKDYYLGPGQLYYKKNRYSIFASEIGLIWNGQNFENLPERVEYYSHEVRVFAMLFTAAAAKNYSFFEIPLGTFAYYNLFEAHVEAKQHLITFFTDLKQKILSE